MIISYRRTCMLVIAVCGAAVAFTRAETPGAPGGDRSDPNLVRMKAFHDKAYFYEFNGPQGVRTPVLVEVAGSGSKMPYQLFPAAGAHFPQGPLRWDCTEGVMYCTHKFPDVHQRTAPSVWLYALGALKAGPDDGGGAIDIEVARRIAPFTVGDRYVRRVPLGPIRAVYLGLSGWKTGDEPLQEGLRASGNEAATVYYDFDVTQDVQMNFVMTIDGQLSAWLFDSERWTFTKTYDLRIDGEFMILEDGASLVAQREDRWCVFSGFDGGERKVTPIAEVDDHEPMTVVDDVDAKRSFLHFKDTLYDAEGRAVQRIAAGLGSAEKVRELANAVRKHRPNERGK